MSKEDVAGAIPNSSIHEAIIREAEEIDWSVDPTEEEEEMCSTSGPKNDADTSSCLDVKTNCGGEDDEDEFNIDELECVDEAAEEERREQKDYERKDKRLHERRSYHSDVTYFNKYRLERHHPYSRHVFGNRRESRTLRDSYRSRHHDSDERRSLRHQASYGRSSQRHARESSNERKQKGGGDEKDIPFDELELEEVDCYDEIGDDGSEFTDGASGTGESHSGEDDDLDDANMPPTVHGASHVDDDFPDLCEEIDVDAMRQAAAATNVVLFDSESESHDVISSPPMAKAKTIKKAIYCGDIDAGKNGGSCSRSFRTSVNGGRRDEACRHHHNVDRNEHRPTRDGRVHHNYSRGREDRVYRGRRASSREARASASAHSDRQEKSTRGDTEIISVEGPLARGWCTVEDEEGASSLDHRSSCKTTPSSDPAKSNGSPILHGHSLKHRLCFEEGDRGRSDGPAKSSRISSPLKRKDSFTTSSQTSHDISSNGGSPRRRDQERTRDLEQSSKRNVQSPKRKSWSNLQQRNGNAISTAEKIPSLLDMCINGIASQHQSNGIPLIDSAIRNNSLLTDGKLQGPRPLISINDSGGSVPKSRSLLDLDIPPPDRDAMRRYAVVLNSCELTKRHINARSGNQNQDAPMRVPLMSPPRRNDRYERSHLPRTYVHGVRR